MLELVDLENLVKVINRVSWTNLVEAKAGLYLENKLWQEIKARKEALQPKPDGEDLLDAKD